MKTIYRIIDDQGADAMSEYRFTTKEQIRQHLIDYHEIDWSDERDIQTLTLDEILDYGEWSIEEITDFYCPLCGATVKYKEWIGTHIYSCEACSFLALEFISEKDTDHLIDYLEVIN